MAPVTAFSVHDPYVYLEGFNNYHKSVLNGLVIRNWSPAYALCEIHC